MIKSQVYASTFTKFNRPSPKRLLLWTVSALLLLLTAQFLLDAIEKGALLWLLFCASWGATILANSLFIDYLLRQRVKRE